MPKQRSLNVRTKLGGAFLAVMDQAIYSAGQLSLNIMLARLLNPGEYGAASAVLAIVSLQYILHYAFIHEPLLIMRRYTSKSAAIVCGAAVIGATLLILSFFDLYSVSGHLGWAAVALVITSEIFWTSRTIQTVDRRFQALCIYGLTLCFGYYVLLRIGTPGNWRSGLYLISMAQIPFIIYVMLRLHVISGASDVVNKNALTIRQSSIYGAQASLSQLSSWVMTGGAILLLGSSTDPEQGGLLKIYVTLLLPIQYVLSALGYYILPKLAADWRDGKQVETYRSIALFAAFGLVSAEIFGLIVQFVGPRVVTIVFGGNYASMDFSPFLYAPAIFAITMCLRTAFRAMVQPTAMLICSVMGAGAFSICVCLRSATVTYMQAVNWMTIGFSVTAVAMACWLMFNANGTRGLAAKTCEK